MFGNLILILFQIEYATSKAITFGQFEEQVHSLAYAFLQNNLLGPDDLVAFLSESTINFALTIGSLLLLDVKYTSLSSGLHNFVQQLIQSEASFLFISENYYPKFENLIRNNEQIKNQLTVIILGDKDFDKKYKTIEDLKSQFQNQQPRISPIPYYQKSMDEIVTLIFTSGSTGMPKAACHTHQSIMTNLFDFDQFKPLKEYQHLNTLLTFPIGHTSGNILFFVFWKSQTTTIFLNYDNIGSIFDAIHKYNIGQIFGSSNAINMLVNKKKSIDDLSTVKLVMNSGCKLPESTADILFNQLKIKIINCMYALVMFNDRIYHFLSFLKSAYGSTETLYISANDNLDKIPETVGKVFPSFNIKILDLETKQEITAPNQTGEICLSGKCVFRSYFKNSAETMKAIDSDGWYHTGDIGCLTDNGELIICDRIREIIKFFGWTVSPANIECFLIKHESILKAVVVPVKHVKYNQVPRAYIEINKDCPINIEQIHQFVNNNLSYAEQLRGGIIIVDNLKCTSMGKVERNYYKKLCENELLKFEI